MLSKLGENEFRFSLFDDSEQVLLTSPVFMTRAKALLAVYECRLLAGRPEHYERIDRADGGHCFIIRNHDGLTIATSRPFGASSVMESLISQCVGSAPTAGLKDPSAG